ncbi:MAG: hypothetical protein WDO17_25905 [Alphaproteobacteria bacterium]
MLVAAVDRVDEQDAVALLAIRGTQDLDIGRVFDHAARIAGRERDVLDDGVPCIPRIDLAIRLAEQALIGASRSKRLSAEGRLDGRDLEPRDARLGRKRERGRGKQREYQASVVQHRRPPGVLLGEVHHPRARLSMRSERTEALRLCNSPQRG